MPLILKSLTDTANFFWKWPHTVPETPLLISGASFDKLLCPKVDEIWHKQP